MRWSQKAEDKELASVQLTNKHFHKPGEKHHSKGTQHGHSERDNLSSALRWSNTSVGANRMQRVAEIKSKANVWGNAQNMQTDLR